MFKLLPVIWLKGIILIKWFSTIRGHVLSAEYLNPLPDVKSPCNYMEKGVLPRYVILDKLYSLGY